MKKLQYEVDKKESEITSLKEELSETSLNNKSLEKKLNASGCFSILDNVKLSDSNPKDFTMVLNYGLKSIRNFAKLLIREMESANWDIEAASNATELGVIFKSTNHKDSMIEKFLKTKYLCLVHPKMETSFFGNLNQRKKINSGEYPETEFFKAFAEMARRVWLRAVH
ncbi:unnamed protein product [Ilex paraguariensis]|uniref:DUF641 domain-containing protein n=1 Tax=Ilex paraguariensis TaxID=185542 RepID=A0ABC8USG1_9AQUA